MSGRPLVDPRSRSPLMILCAAWNLLEGGWCQRAYARDEWRHAVSPLSPQATRFCVGAAVYRAAVDLGLAGVDEHPFDPDSWVPDGDLASAFAFVGKQFVHYWSVSGIKLETSADGVRFASAPEIQPDGDERTSLPWWRFVILSNDTRLTTRVVVDTVMMISILAVCDDFIESAKARSSRARKHPKEKR